MTVVRRKGIASVVGLLFMVLVFMVAIGAQVYTAGLQAQSSAAAAQAQQRSAQKSDEVLSFTSGVSGLTATDTGPSSAAVVGMVLKFENGTSYVLGPGTSPAFSPSTLASSGAASVQSLVPAGVCAPGSATCLSKYLSIVGSRAQGRAVGLVTSMGNTFWYVPSASPSAPDPTTYRTSSTQSTASSSFVAVSGLSFTGAASTVYTVEVFVAYYQASVSGASIEFAISVPAGASFLFCGGEFWSNPSAATTDLGPGNLCTSLPNTSLGPTSNTQNFCYQQGSGMCEFVGTALVTFGPTAGAFQFEFASSSTDTATVVTNSFMVVTPD